MAHSRHSPPESPPESPAQNHEERFNRLVRTYRPALLAYATMLLGGDGGRAEDVVQETFVRAWSRLDRMSPEHGSVNGWLRRVAYNLCADWHRSRRCRPVEVELLQTDVAIPADATADVETALVVQQALSAIWPEHRAVLIEVYLNDRTTAQAAAVLGIPVGTVKSRLHYALRTLRGAAPEPERRAS